MKTRPSPRIKALHAKMRGLFGSVMAKLAACEAEDKKLRRKGSAWKKKKPQEWSPASDAEDKAAFRRMSRHLGGALREIDELNAILRAYPTEEDKP